MLPGDAIFVTLTASFSVPWKTSKKFSRFVTAEKLLRPTDVERSGEKDHRTQCSRVSDRFPGYRFAFIQSFAFLLRGIALLAIEALYHRRRDCMNILQKNGRIVMSN